MKKVKRQWDVLTDKRRRECVDEIIGYFQRERDEKIGIVAAEDILDFFLREVGKDVYQKAITDSKTLLQGRLADLEVDLDLLLDK